MTTSTTGMSEITVHPARPSPATSNAKKAGMVRKSNRPNYNHIHRNLLPIETYPLPTLIPHNPLSILAIALSYLAHVLRPPTRTTYNGYFSSATSSIHITDEATQRALWEMGFFGRGNLSRSEPTWFENQKQVGVTAEENTNKRRTERRQFKLDRAKVEQQEIAEQMIKEVLGSRKIPRSVSEELQALIQQDKVAREPEKRENGHALPPPAINIPKERPALPPGTIEGFDEWKKTLDVTGLPTPPPTSTCSESCQPGTRPKKLQRQKTVRFSPTTEAREFDLSSPITVPIKAPCKTPDEEVKVVVKLEPVIENKEHLQLSMEEAFFLAYSLGVLNISSEHDSVPFGITSLLALFRRHSYSPPRSLSVAPQPDDPFLLSYAVYHHYRSQGWVVRSGIKFGVDYLLYNRGPAFSHAEFAVIVLPSYTDDHWSGIEKEERLTKTKK
ncbi:tRNA splicing endonuclease subunit sen2, partial [Elasticomyces elasticus]